MGPRHMYRTAVVSTAALILVLAGCSAGPADDAADDGPQRVTATLREFAIEPAPLEIEAGRPAVVAVDNAGAIVHNLGLADGAATEAIPAGGSAELELPALEVGRYRLLCSIEGHEAAGMVAELVVRDGDQGASAMAHRMSAEDMARLHVAGVKAFPAETAGLGNQSLAPKVAADGVKEFHLKADEIDWETKPGVRKAAFAYNGQVPGPRIDVDQGDRVRIVLHNALEVPTALHFHGLLVPNAMDGVPAITQDPVMPGESFTYEFTVRNAGSHMYHSHFDAAKQVPMGLLGAFVVRDPAEKPADVDEVMVLNDGPLGFTLNGKDFPGTRPIVAKAGQRVRVRYMNEGLQVHPMHLHGMAQRVVARDGYPVPAPYLADTVLVGPGERIDVIVDATEKGIWAYHCHILNHAEAEDGMFGMVTAFVVE